jgi:hypothetical protein
MKPLKCECHPARSHGSLVHGLAHSGLHQLSCHMILGALHTALVADHAGQCLVLGPAAADQSCSLTMFLVQPQHTCAAVAGMAGRTCIA